MSKFKECWLKVIKKKKKKVKRHSDWNITQKFLKVINEQNTFCIPKYGGQKLACWCLCTLIALDGFHQLLSTHLAADLTLEWSGGSMFHPLSHIYTKTPFCCIETVTNNARNRRHVVFDQLWANTAPTLNTAFSLTNVHAKWWIHCHLIFSTPLLSHATSIYDQPKQVCRVFCCFGQPKCSVSFVSVWLHLKSVCHLLTVVSKGVESK